jgi:hypothetical protein
MSWTWNPRWRLTWFVASAVGTVFFVGLDWLLRWSGHSALAPTVTNLWLSVGWGIALGLASMLWEGYLLRNRAAFLLAFHRAPLTERLKWKYQGPNLLMSGWLVIAIWSLIAWCIYKEVFVGPAICAMNAVLFMGNRRALQEFNAKRLQTTGILSAPRGLGKGQTISAGG